MLYTLAEAAKAVGRTKPAILHAIKKGTISAQKNDIGQWEVDPSELFRVYKQAKNDAENDNRDSALLIAEKDGQINGLKDRLQAMEELVVELRADKETATKREEAAAIREADLRRDIEQWRGFAFDAQQRLKALEAPKPEPVPAAHTVEADFIEAEQPQPTKKGFLRRLFG